MKLLKASEIKKILIGVIISDGYIDMNNYRFDFYSKNEEYAKYIYNVLKQISGMNVHFKIKHDKRGYTGYRVFTRNHPYWKNLGEKFYNGRKELNEYISSRVDEKALANIWMSDGYLEHAKNRKKNKVQNIGWFCLESFPKEELEIFQKHLFDKFSIKTSLAKKPWGFGYRIRVGGENLQKLISIIHEEIIESFKYKTLLFYKEKSSANMNLPSAEQYIVEYNDIEDIVRYFQK